MTREPRSCCQCCTSVIISLGVSALFIWLNLRRHSPPILSIEQFYVPSLNDTRNTTITFDLKLKNRNKSNGIHYDTINLTLYYSRNLTSPIANCSIPRFYQGHKKTAHKNERFDPVEVPWESARKEVSNGTTAFRVEVKTQVRYKNVFWTTKRRKIWGANNVTVNNMGALKDGAVILSSAYAYYVPLSSPLFALVYIFICF